MSAEKRRQKATLTVGTVDSKIHSHVFVGKKCPRGVVGAKDPFIEGVKNVNATTGSGNKFDGLSCRDFSPMLLGPVIEEDIFNIESGTGVVATNMELYYQGSKIWKELGHLDEEGNTTDEWRKFRDKNMRLKRAFRRPPSTRSKEYTIGKNGKKKWKYHTAVSSEYMGERMDYITGRKKIYAIVYTYLVIRTQVYQSLKKYVDKGLSVMILDHDILPGNHKITVDFLRERINDPKFPFGHGYVLAGLLAGITPDMYI